MAVRVFTSNPNSLMHTVRLSITTGTVVTWSIDSDGDLTHSPEQWRNRAWFRPKVLDDRIIFNLLGPKSKSLTRTEYAVFHGRLIEMFLTHFDERFTRVTATALPAEGDIVTPIKSKISDSRL
jgi:hypothetical protein